MSQLLTTEKRWTIEEIATQEAVDISTVRRWTKHGRNRLKTLRLGYRTVRVLDSDYQRFLQNRTA